MKPEFIDLKWHGDQRGGLVAIEQLKDVPFVIRRIYYIINTMPGARRGCHAHYALQQMAVCLAGSCRFVLDDGRSRSDFALGGNHRGLKINPLVWHEIHDFSPDCILLVLADSLYCEADYIHTYEEFLAALKTPVSYSLKIAGGAGGSNEPWTTAQA